MHPPKRTRLISPPQSATTQSECLVLRGTIVRLSDDVLLNIFRYYLDVSPRFWPTLVHICRKWRHIVFTSQRALNLRLFSSSGTSVSKALDCWPVLPIVMEYGGSLAFDPSAPEDEVNIIAALMRTDRVSSISLIITTSLLDKLCALERPFLVLESLVLLSRDRVPLKLPSDFRWGPRLRRLHLTRITVPALLPLLHSSRNLVDLQLHEALKSWNPPIEKLTGALSGMAELQSLSLRFSSTTNHVPPPSAPDRVVLPALTCLKFWGPAKYLERLILRMDAPRLGYIEVTVSEKFTYHLPRLGEFVNRIQIHMSHRQAHILTSEHAISISLTQPGVLTCFKFRLLSERSSDQLFPMSYILPNFAAFLFNVEDLRISATQASSQENRFYSGSWLRLLNSFTGVKWLHLDVNDSTNVVRALQDMYERPKTTVLPVLYKLYLPHPGPRHAPLSEPIVSFMASRWRSGYPIGVEYERLRISELHAPGPFSEPVTIDHEMLCGDILLNIFRQYLDATPRRWSILTHVCRRWQQVILRSPLGLQLRLYCTYRTPVLNNLDCWPPVPLVINYGGSPILNPPAPEDEDNIIAALKQSDRVNSISLTLTNSLLGKLSTIYEPFSELEELVLLSQDKLQLTLPRAFRWGLRLRTLHVTRVVIPSLPALLSSSTDLVDLQLHEIPMAGYFSPEVFANVLSGTSHLRSLSLHFLSFPPSRNYVGLPPPDGHLIVLSALTCFKYRGISKYLDSFVTRINAPHLRDIDITFFSQPTMDASQLGRFIERIGMQTSLIKAEIQISAHAIFISFQNSTTSTRLRLQISCKQLDWQLSSVAQVCEQFSPFLFGIKTLAFNSNDFPSGQGDVDAEQWLQLVHSFGGAKTLSIAGEHSTGILCALRPANEGHTTGTAVLPVLRNLRIRKPMPLDWPFWEAAQSLIRSRELSCHPIDSELQVLCPICNTGFTPEQLGVHLEAQHAYERACSYCVDFKVRRIFQFQEHLRSEHPEVTHNDKLISQRSHKLTPLQIDTLTNRHSFLRKHPPP